MACERYREEVLGAAAGWLEPEGEIRLHAHLRACSACREEYDQQKCLFAALDQGLRERVSEELPVGFAARVRARVNEESAPRRQWFSRWVPAWGTVAAAAVLAAGLFVIHLIRRDAGGPEKQPAPVAINVAPNKPAEPAQAHPAKTPDKSLALQPNRVRTVSVPVMITGPEVLLPAGQKRAMARLVEGLRNGKVQGEMLLAETRELQPLQISALEFDPVELKPLEDSHQQLQ